MDMTKGEGYAMNKIEGALEPLTEPQRSTARGPVSHLLQIKAPIGFVRMDSGCGRFLADRAGFVSRPGQLVSFGLAAPRVSRG